MKKIIAMALTAALAVSAMAGFTALADDEPIKVLINGEELVIPEGDTQPFIEDSRTLVPMRAIFEALGATVNWDGETRTIVSYDPISDVSITMQIDLATMFVGETKVELDVPAKIVNDRTVVPVRAIAEGMNSDVQWQGESRTVVITKDLTKAEDADAAQIANPWTEFATLDELNAALNEAEGYNANVKYSVADPSAPAEVKENGYRYLAEDNLTEIQATWAVGEGADVVIRTIPGTVDAAAASGYQQFDKVEEYTLENGSVVTVYKYENTLFAVWTDAAELEAGIEINHSVAVTSDDDLTEVLKTLVEDVDAHYPKG